jgi:hypothetical protein
MSTGTSSDSRDLAMPLDTTIVYVALDTLSQDRHDNHRGIPR